MDGTNGDRPVVETIGPGFWDDEWKQVAAWARRVEKIAGKYDLDYFNEEVEAEFRGLRDALQRTGAF